MGVIQLVVRKEDGERREQIIAGVKSRQVTADQSKDC